jgi:hypothetical protein
MQLLISLCISLQFYLQFLQFLLPLLLFFSLSRLLGELWGHALEQQAYRSGYAEAKHVAYLALHFLLAFRRLCTREGQRAQKKCD